MEQNKNLRMWSPAWRAGRSVACALGLFPEPHQGQVRARDLNHRHHLLLRSQCYARANIFQLIKVSGRKRTRRFYLFLITTRAQQYSNYRLRLLFRLGRQKSSEAHNPTHTQTSPSESKLHQGRS
jgi:hypothetical protein